MSQLANRAEQMILSESMSMSKLKLKPLMKPGLRKPRSKKVSWSDKLITEYIVCSEMIMTECNTA
jgi:hypothetical protein